MASKAGEFAKGFEKAAEFESAFEDSLLHWFFSPLMTEKCVRIMLIDFDVFHSELVSVLVPVHILDYRCEDERTVRE
jgi:hypothetical protein